MFPLKLKYVKLGYQYVVNHFLTLLLISIMLSITLKLVQQGYSTHDDIIHYFFRTIKNLTFLNTLLCCILVIVLSAVYYMSRPRPVYLVDYACYNPPSTYRMIFSTFMEHARLIVKEQKSTDFLMKILERSGLGEETALPPAVHCIPPNPTISACREEAESVIFSSLDKLFSNTGLCPKDVDFLIVNCSLFSPTPSMSAMVVNKYKMRGSVQSYNLSGMGCSAGLISVNLAKDLLCTRVNSNAVVVSTEILTPNYYCGKERAMLLPNCLFRMGGAAVLMSNKKSCRKIAKYRLQHVVRTHKGSDDKAYTCVFEVEDGEGNVGISLNKNLMSIAAEALKSNITTIGPLVLPTSEQLMFVASLIGRKLINPKWKPYIPDFKLAFEHFCIHAGGRAVIDELQKNLQLSSEHVEASRMTLHRFGNTSSSSLWYELAYIEAKGKMKKGDSVWQIAFGSGFKCNSAVWKCLREINNNNNNNNNTTTNNTTTNNQDSPWADCIHKYPVYIPDVVKL